MLNSASCKNIMYKVALLFWVQLFFYPHFTQSPSHFFIGQNELAGIDIYSVYKSSTKSLYLGTSNGVFLYKQGKFLELTKSPDRRGSSFFQIQENSLGELFCSNLHGQLFQLSNDSIQLFYELPENEVGDQFHFYINTDNSFIYASKFIGKITRDKKLTMVLSPSCTDTSSCQYFHASKIDENKYFICHSILDSSIIYNNGKIQYFNRDSFVNKNTLIDGNSFKVIKLKNQPILIGSSGKAFTNSSIISNIKEYPSERFLSISDNKILALNSKSGARFLFLNNDTLQASDKILDNLFISSAAKGKSGILYLGTFGNGLCIIPSTENTSITIDASLRGITVSQEGICYVSSKEGNIYKIDADSTYIIHESKRTQDWIFHCEKCGKNELSQLIFDPIEGGNAGVIKDYYFPTSARFGFIATSNGIYNIGTENFENENWTRRDESWLSKLNSINGRQKAVVYNYNKSLLYGSDESNLFQIDFAGNRTNLQWDNKNIFANDLEIKGDSLICATDDKGILIFWKNKPILQLDVNNGLIHNKIKKIRRIGDQLLILSQGGFQTLNLATLKLQTYGVPEGLIENTIIDFDANDKKMFFLIKNKVLILPYTQTKILPKDIALNINSITLGGKPLQINATNSFKHDENNLQLLFDFKSEILNNETSVFYKLSGTNDGEWNELSATAKSIQYQSLAPGKYTLDILTRCRDVVSEQYSIPFKINPPFWQQWWFFLIVALALFTISFLFYRRRLKIQNVKSQQINELNASKLTAIQSQMNPHFIFNALNSIQALVLKGDVKNSYTFITKFSNLVRRTLNYSDKDFISFNQEIKLIELYLSLEKLRFKDDLAYQIIENNIDDIKVPPMLIQPFIENALVHGLLHKEGKKKVIISFKLEDTLICTITDNGIGRKKSMKIKERQRSEHESFSGNAIKRRFAILEKHFGGNLGFSYLDLEKDGYPTGTSVTLRIPIKNEF